MKYTLIERLPGCQAVYKMRDQRSVYPGQWLSSGKDKFPVINSNNQETHFIAAEGSLLPTEFEISGEPLSLAYENKPLLLLADNQAIPLLFFLINQLRLQWGEKQLRSSIYQILLGTNSVFPFRPVPSRFLIADFPAGTIASSQLLEDLALPARLASANDSPGCFIGTLPMMLKQLKFDAFLETAPLVVAMGSSDLLQTTKKLFNEQLTKQFLIAFEN